MRSGISAVSEVTWEEINPCLLRSAHEAKLERGEMLRFASAGTGLTDPRDSTLLWDSVRMLVRLLERKQKLTEGMTQIEYHNHLRLAKERARVIHYSHGQEGLKHFMAYV